MIRIVLAAVLAIPAAPSLAQATVGVTHQEAGGPASGRSPHKAYRETARVDAACGKPSISVPGGKLPHYGTHHARPDCAAATGIAAADADRTTRRD